jgi:hypothetical protein
MDSSESIPGLHKRLQIRTRISHRQSKTKNTGVNDSGEQFIAIPWRLASDPKITSPFK